MIRIKKEIKEYIVKNILKDGWDDFFPENNRVKINTHKRITLETLTTLKKLLKANKCEISYYPYDKVTSDDDAWFDDAWLVITYYF